MSKYGFLFVSVLLFTSACFGAPSISFTWENSFLTGTVNIKTEVPEDIIIYQDVKGGQSHLVIRCNLIEYFSVAAGSGVFVNKLRFLYDEGWWYGFTNDSIAMFYVSFFGELRGQMPVFSDLLYLYAGAKLGNSISPPKVSYYYSDYYFASGLFFEPSIGFLLSVRRFLLDLGVAYHLQKSGLIEDNYGYISEYPFVLKQFALKLGLGVSFGKKR
jgi:hypothetical protein